jgi:hypothetical protein
MIRPEPDPTRPNPLTPRRGQSESKKKKGKREQTGQL